MSKPTVRIIDSGYLGDDISRNRIYHLLRELNVDVLSISHVDSAKTSNLLMETDEDRRERDQTRRRVEQQRIENTADFFNIKKIDVDKALEEESDIIIIIMRPEDDTDDRPEDDTDDTIERKTRYQLIQLAVRKRAKTIVLPPYFKSEEDRKNLNKQLSETQRNNLYFFTPYRYSRGMTHTLNILSENQIAAIHASVISGPYQPFNYVREFCFPVIDTISLLAGETVNTDIRIANPQGKYIIAMTASHGTTNAKNNPLSQLILSTAGGGFQDTQNYNLRVIQTNNEFIDIVSSFKDIIHTKSGDGLHRFTDASDDPSDSVLLHKILTTDFQKDKDILKPTIENLSITQTLLDTLVNEWRRFEETDESLKQYFTQDIRTPKKTDNNVKENRQQRRRGRPEGSRDTEKYTDLNILLNMEKGKPTDSLICQILGIGKTTLKRWRDDYLKTRDEHILQTPDDTVLFQIQMKYAIRELLDGAELPFMRQFCEIVDQKTIPAGTDDDSITP